MIQKNLLKVLVTATGGLCFQLRLAAAKIPDGVAIFSTQQIGLSLNPSLPWVCAQMPKARNCSLDHVPSIYPKGLA